MMRPVLFHLHAVILVLAAAAFVTVCIAEEPELPAVPADQEQEAVPQEGAAAEQVQPAAPPATFPPAKQEPAVADPNTIAVVYFTNAGEDTTYDPLQKALTDMVITDLSQVSSLKLVERTRMADILKEKEFSLSDASAKDLEAKNWIAYLSNGLLPRSLPWVMRKRATRTSKSSTSRLRSKPRTVVSNRV